MRATLNKVWFLYDLLLRYRDNAHRFSSTGQVWIGNVRRCLQQALGPTIGNYVYSCAGRKATAFDTHVQCYVDNGFCNLPLSDYLKIVQVVGDTFVPFNGDAAQSTITAAQTLTQCASQLWNSWTGKK